MQLQHNTETQIKSLGWNEQLAQNFVPFSTLGYIPLRIIKESRGYYWGSDGIQTYLLQRSGSFNNLLDLAVQQTPVVGDWCAVNSYESEKGLIEAVLPRISEFHKALVHEEGYVTGFREVVASNVDAAFIVIDSHYDFNIHKIERYLSILFADHITPMLVLTKVDLVEDPLSLQSIASERFSFLRVFPVDSLTGNGIEGLLLSLKARKTYMLLGSSGAGKSTLVNRLYGKDVTKTQEVRVGDGKGRHTTTSRSLHQLPSGALLLDTPGIRGVGMNSSASEIAESFSDIAALASHCRFHDCSHTAESGCAVKNALQSGELKQDRYEHYLLLKHEAMSWEEVMGQRRKKDKTLGKVLYQYRRREGKHV
ncbi:ribosome small subunit-dependent GTPase A [uncultured Sphaerochaeta sp.]|uniref:ribosome small subunit-dependent GTPase A n=1 Tax=uncultured Sphaerochaeta sp. TaxID=886478 RepID=UPI002AA800E2|nr:ribosome small subunit-dependent GTPase A [uncultured Sphaerochaeta sp.]